MALGVASSDGRPALEEVGQVRARSSTTSLLLLALFVSALSLRPQVIGMGPLLPRIQADLGVPHGVVGLLSAIPVLCMGVFAPAAAFASGRFGSRRALTACLVAIAAFGLARASAPGTVALLATTLCIGVPVGVAGALLPVAVKESFADRPVVATGVYASGIQLGAAASALAAVPVAQIAGGWRGTLVAFSVFGLVLAIAWVLVSREADPRPARAPRPRRLPVRSGVAWLITGIFFLQSVPYYGLNAWMPAHLVTTRWSEAAAGGVLALTNFSALLTTLLVPALANRYGTRRQYLAGAAGLVCTGTVGLLVAPALALAWAVVAGMGLGALFPIVLTLPLDVTDDPASAGAMAGLMFGVGYAASALTPTALGFVRDATGGFSASLWLIAGVCVVLAGVALTLSPTRLHAGVDRIPVPPPPVP